MQSPNDYDGFYIYLGEYYSRLHRKVRLISPSILLNILFHRCNAVVLELCSNIPYISHIPSASFESVSFYCINNINISVWSIWIFYTFQ